MQRPVAVLGAFAVQAVPLTFFAFDGAGLVLAFWVLVLGALCAGLWVGSRAAWVVGVGLGVVVALTAGGTLPFFRLGAVLYGLALAGCLLAARRWFFRHSVTAR